MKLEPILASTTKRIFARICDILFFMFILVIAFLFFNQFTFFNITFQILFINLIFLLVFIVYFVFVPYFFSYQTLAKKLFGIRLLFSSSCKKTKIFLSLFMREFFIIFVPVFLTWILYFFYFLIMNLLDKEFNSIYFLQRASIIIFLWWLFYFIFVRINPQHQVFLDRWFSVFVIDVKINFFISNKKKMKKKLKSNNSLISNQQKDYFEGSFVSLNKEQKQATTYSPDYNLRIIAGPGTGKTTVLTERITFLFKKHQILPQRILTLTFTRKACENIKNKIIKALKQISTDNLPVFTYHAFCYFVLKREKKYLKLENQEISVLDRSDQLQLIKILLSKQQDNKQRIDSDLAKKIIVIINYLQQKKVKNYSNFLNLTNENYLFEELKNEQKTNIWYFWLDYNNYKQKEGFLDFNDLLIKTHQIFQQNPKILKKWRNKYDYLAIDEFQDISSLQFDIVKLLTNSGKDLRLTVVGDPDQTIYGWRGANVDFILDLDKHFYNLVTIKLIVNYRSTKNIVNLANLLIENNKKRVAKKLIAQEKQGKKIFLFGGYKEANFVVEQIEKLSANLVPLNQIAILYRINSVSGILENFLIKKNLPYQIFKGLEFFKRKEIKELLVLLSILFNPKDIHVENLLSWINGIGPSTIVRVRKLANAKKETIFNFLSKNNLIFLTRFQEQINSFWSVFKTINNNLNNLKSLKIIIRKLFQDIYEPILQNNVDYEQRLKNIDALIVEVVVEFEGNHLNLSIREKISEFLVHTNLSAADDLSNSRQKINLMTIHSAKGLEFSHVFIFNVSSNNFPNLFRSTIDVEEERRLFFVAITRAKKELFITTSDNSNSIFIEEIEDFDSIEYLT